MKAEKFRLDNAEHYIASQKSDPFARARVETHMRTGIVGFNSQGQDAFYSAEPFQEERITASGDSYMATVYRNIQRP